MQIVQGVVYYSEGSECKAHSSEAQFQDCYRDDYGNVIFTFKNSELVKVITDLHVSAQELTRAQTELQNLLVAIA